MSRTLAEKLLRADAGETIVRDVDLVMSHDATTPLAIEAFVDMPNESVWDPKKVVIVFDHVYPATTPQIADIHNSIERFVKKQKIRNFFPGQGICHQILPEKGLVRPGMLVVGADSHSCTYGAFGAFGVGMGSTDIAVVWTTGQTWLQVPESIRIILEGNLPKRVSAKDLILDIIKTLGPAGATAKAVEYGGSFANKMIIADRMTLSNMAVEAGGMIGLFPSDEITSKFYNGSETIAIFPDKRAIYEQEFQIDISALEPQVACPDSVENVEPISEVSGTEIDTVFIGTCTNGRIEDFRCVVELSRGKRFKTKTILVPASSNVYLQAINEGLIQELINSGASIGNPGCGPCLGRQGGVLGEGEVCFSTGSRNYKGRMGSPDARIYIGSAYSAAATALAGKITDPRQA